LDNISISLLFYVFTLVTNLTKKLESKDIADFTNGNSAFYIPVNKVEKYQWNIEGKDVEEPGVIDDLKEIISICKKTKPTRLKNETIFSLIKKCNGAVKYLSDKYPLEKRFVNKNALQEDDRNQLLEGLDDDLDSLGDMLYDNTEIILNLESKQSLDVDKKSLKILDKSAKADLEDGFTLLQLGHTTSSYMIFMRVAEFLVQQYYKKITGYYPKNDDAAWGQMLHSLQDEYKSKIDKNFTNLLYYLKDKRNEAQHPGKRFDEKDCNKLIMYLTEYVDYFAKQK
tara:strand:- start:616 stop:1464 length:849 start_codon:yes stop_codon:yes gene_type:complete